MVTPWATRYGGLGLVLLLGVTVRLFLLLQWPRRLNGDEATAGLMALHILRGEFPVFMYSVAYQGTVEAYLTAVVYTLVGASPLTLKVTVFLFSCLLIVIAFLIGRRVAGWPGGLCCALFVAMAPPFLSVYGNYAMLGYMEVVVIGSLVLLLTLDLLSDERAGAHRSRKLLILGLVAGLGWWINPMILSYLAAAGVFLVFRPALWSSRGLWAVPLAFFLGSLPSWIFNLNHSFWSFRIFRGAGEGDLAANLRTAFRLLLEIGGVRGLLADPVPFLSPAAGVVYLVLLGILFVDLGSWNARQDPDARRRRRALQILFAFSLFHLAAFSLSRYVEFAVQRYLFPLYSSLPILTGMAVLRLWRWSRLLSAGALVLLLLNNGLALWKTVQFFEAARRDDWWKPEPVIDLLQSEGLTRAYAPLQIAPRLTFETQEHVIVADPLSERYPPYLRAADVSPRVAYILARRLELAPNQFESSLQGIGATYQRQDLGDFSVFYNFQPPSDRDLVSIPPEGWQAEAEPSGFDPTRAFDREVDTAWFSGQFLRPGMWYRLDLGKIVPVGGIALLPARPHFGIPKGYRVELSRDGRTWDTVALVPEFVVTLRWRDGQPRVDRSGQIVSRFALRPARYIRIIQTGENSKEWWAIAELFVYGQSASPGGERKEILAHLREGIQLENRRQFGLALTAYEKAVRLDPEWEEAHWRIVEVYRTAELPIEGSEPYRRGLIFERLGMWARAARQYETLLARAPEHGSHSGLLSRLVEIYRRQGDGGKADRVERRLRGEYSPPTRAEIRFGRFARLLGYGLEPREPRAGEVVELSYYWQALKPMAEDLAVFVHFIRDGKVRFQQDHEPLHGSYPTSRWQEGELVRESYRVRLPQEMPAGEYEIRIGLWNPMTGKRVRVAQSDLPHFRDEVRLATVRLLPPR